MIYFYYELIRILGLVSAFIDSFSFMLSCEQTEIDEWVEHMDFEGPILWEEEREERSRLLFILDHLDLDRIRYGAGIRYYHDGTGLAFDDNAIHTLLEIMEGSIYKTDVSACYWFVMIITGKKLTPVEREKVLAAYDMHELLKEWKARYRGSDDPFKCVDNVFYAGSSWHDYLSEVCMIYLGCNKGNLKNMQDTLLDLYDDMQEDGTISDVDKCRFSSLCKRMGMK